MAVTVPATGAETGVSIFIASKTTSSWFTATTSPTATLILNTSPIIGLGTAVPSPAGAAAGAAATGAAATGAAATGAGALAAIGATAGAAEEESKTSTSTS